MYHYVLCTFFTIIVHLYKYNQRQLPVINKQQTNHAWEIILKKDFFLLCPATYNPLLMLSISQSRGKSEVSHNEKQCHLCT